jgi:hypothetical protein
MVTDTGDGNRRTALPSPGPADKANKRTPRTKSPAERLAAASKESIQLEGVNTIIVTHLQPYLRNPKL